MSIKVCCGQIMYAENHKMKSHLLEQKVTIQRRRLGKERESAHREPKRITLLQMFDMKSLYIPTSKEAG